MRKHMPHDMISRISELSFATYDISFGVLTEEIASGLHLWYVSYSTYLARFLPLNLLQPRNFSPRLLVRTLKVVCMYFPSPSPMLPHLQVAYHSFSEFLWYVVSSETGNVLISSMNWNRGLTSYSLHTPVHFSLYIRTIQYVYYLVLRPPSGTYIIHSSCRRAELTTPLLFLVWTATWL